MATLSGLCNEFKISKLIPVRSFESSKFTIINFCFELFLTVFQRHFHKILTKKRYKHAKNSQKFNKTVKPRLDCHRQYLEAVIYLARITHEST